MFLLAVSFFILFWHTLLTQEVITFEVLICEQQPCERNADERLVKWFLNAGRNKAELLMLILEHFSPVFKLLCNALEIQWLLPNLIKFSKKHVADFVKVCFLGVLCVFFFLDLNHTK